MPELNWVGKKAVLNHHRHVPYRLLKCDGELSVGDPSCGNLLVQGDNLEALKALLPYYAGQVKCVVIDPPYNTGDENWVYNDNVNSSEIRQWLGKVVGSEADDLSRHDKWFCMMYPRLKLLRQFLRQDGVIFVSIDENEEAYLRLLMDEIYDRRNALGTLVWKRRSPSAMRGTPLSIDHEYVLVYATDSQAAKLYGLTKGIEGYPYEDERGHYASTDLTIGMGRDARPGQFYPITNPRTGKVYPANPERVWRFWPETMNKVIAEGLVIWPDDFPDRRMERPRYKTYYDAESEKPKPVSSWIEASNANDREVEADEAEYDMTILRTGMNQEGGKLLQQILGTRVFAYPKPLSLIRSLIRATTRSGDLVLDSFAGTGTVGHAVLDMNREDEGKRQFILVEMDERIAREVTAERLRRVIEGYSYQSTRGGEKRVEGLGGGLRFCTLGDPLTDEQGNIRSSVRFRDLAHHVFFTETGMPLPKKASAKSPYLGECNGTAYFLLFNGVLGDKRPDGGNVLTASVLASLPKHEGKRVVYGEGCRLSPARLKRENVVFRQIPYEVKVG
jgi:adenine-specific DNA-methyltransferase